jgi:F-type H+-transporting ATPase subunit b
MVTLNFTLLIELGLFLVFMWVTHKMFFVPTIRNMDDRDESIGQDYVQAEANVEKAKALTSEYRSELIRIRGEAETQLAEAKHKTAQEHMKFVQTERARSDETVAKARAKARKEVDDNRDFIISSSTEMVNLISQRLNASYEDTADE